MKESLSSSRHKNHLRREDLLKKGSDGGIGRSSFSYMKKEGRKSNIEKKIGEEGPLSCSD